MSVYFLYGTLRPGSRHGGFLSQIGATDKGPAILVPGYRLAVRYRGHGEDRFDRNNSSHYVEPILIRDRTCRDRVCGSLFEIASDQSVLATFVKVLGQPRAYPLVPLLLESGQTVLGHVRSPDAHDLVHRTDPCLHRFADGRTLFYDAATYIHDQCKLVEIPTTSLYQHDIQAGTFQRRISVEIDHPTTHIKVPAFEYVPRD